MTYTLGQSVVVQAQVVKEHPIPDGDADTWFTRWVRKPSFPPVAGTVVGKRTVKEGHEEYDEEGARSFKYTRHIEVYLVAYNMRRKPMFVLPEDMEAVEKATLADMKTEMDDCVSVHKWREHVTDWAAEEAAHRERVALMKAEEER
jgi:hypothetical protein